MFPKLIGVVGQIKVFEPQIRTDKSYECAAWWQTTKTDVGVYDIGLQSTNGHYWLTALIPATVIDADFSTHFCGNRLGGYDKSNDVGKRTVESIGVAPIEAIKQYANFGPNEKGLLWCFKPQSWMEIRMSYSSALAESMQNIFSEVGKDIKDLKTWLRRLSYNSGLIQEASDAILEIDRKGESLSNSKHYEEANTNFGPSLRKLEIIKDSFNGAAYNRWILE